MSNPSNWPLPRDGIRFLVPRSLVDAMRDCPLSADLYPTAFGYYPRAHGHAARRPDHDDHLLIYCVRGRAHVQVAGVDQVVSGGQLVTLEKGVAHEYAADARDPWTVYWVHFDGSRSRDYLNQARAHPAAPEQALASSAALPCVRSLGTLSKAISDFDALLDTRRSAHQRSAFIHAANHLKQLICYLGLPRPPTRDTDMLDAVHALMREHLIEGVRLDDLAAAAGLSRHHFCRRYRRLTGTTPLARFAQLRMERASHLLDVTARSVAAIAADVGIDDPYYFSRQFRKVVGVSPSAYRQLRRG